MIFLGLSILSSIGIFVAFRMFSSYGVHTRQGIMINYLVAGIVGLVVFQPTQFWLQEPWFAPSCALGLLFYVIFRIMGRVTQFNGLSVASLAAKMSVVIPVSIGLIFLDESLSALKLMGIALGLASIVLSAGASVKGRDLLWPLVLFIGSGVIDASLNLFQHAMVDESAFPMFVSNIFLSAFIAALAHHLLSHERKVSIRSVIGGLGLGLVNFAALYFILRSLALPEWESSLVFPINNFGIIAGSTLLGVFALGERLTTRAWTGFGFATLSILLLYFAK
ncbi:MAG: DMT family transporter [Flavobacteriales bacterium]|nr:DMT family transporter [Flavobacteriales bacterium]